MLDNCAVPTELTENFITKYTVFTPEQSLSPSNNVTRSSSALGLRSQMNISKLKQKFRIKERKIKPTLPIDVSQVKEAIDKNTEKSLQYTKYSNSYNYSSQAILRSNKLRNKIETSKNNPNRGRKSPLLYRNNEHLMNKLRTESSQNHRNKAILRTLKSANNIHRPTTPCLTISKLKQETKITPIRNFLFIREGNNHNIWIRIGKVLK